MYTGNDQWVWELEEKIIKNGEDIVNFGFYFNSSKEENNENELFQNQVEETTLSMNDDTRPILPIGWIVAMRKEGITSCYTL